MSRSRSKPPYQGLTQRPRGPTHLSWPPGSLPHTWTITGVTTKDFLHFCPSAPFASSTCWRRRATEKLIQSWDFPVHTSVGPTKRPQTMACPAKPDNISCKLFITRQTRSASYWICVLYNIFLMERSCRTQMSNLRCENSLKPQDKVSAEVLQVDDNLHCSHLI